MGGKEWHEVEELSILKLRQDIATESVMQAVADLEYHVLCNCFERRLPAKEALVIPTTVFDLVQGTFDST